MHGLDLVNQLVNKKTNAAFIKKYQDTFKPGTALANPNKKEADIPIKPKHISFDYNLDAITAPTYSPQILTESLDHLWPYINRQMLYGHHLGLKGNIKKLFANNDAKALKLDRQIQEVRQQNEKTVANLKAYTNFSKYAVKTER